MDLSLSFVIASCACLFALGGFAFTLLAGRKHVARLDAELDAHKALIKQLSETQQHFRHTVDEGQARTLAVASTVKAMERDIAALTQQIKVASEQDPDSRLYKKAADMLQSGASAEEVMLSCDLPVAEVQLLMNIHKST